MKICCSSVNSWLFLVFYVKILFYCLKNFQISPRMSLYNSNMRKKKNIYARVYVYIYMHIYIYMHVNIWVLNVMLNDDLLISFKEVALYYLLTYLEYYATRKQTLGEGLYLPVGPWNHYIHLTLVDNSRVVQEDKEGGSFFLWRA